MIDQMIDRLLQREGGFVDNKFDKGGPTKHGITQETLEKYRALDPETPTTIHFLDKSFARRIYKTIYWEQTNICRIKNQFLAEMVLDQAVNCGPDIAIKRLQASINFISRDRNITEDGIIGPITVKAIDYSPPIALALAFFRRTQIYYIKLCIKDYNQMNFIVGWINRSHILLELAVRANSVR